MIVNIKSQVPNLLTLGNLICGIFIIISSFQLNFIHTLYFAIACLIFDFLDGTFARLLNVSSTIGKELDSLADMVSFGVAPSLVLYNYWLNESMHVNSSFSIHHISVLIAAFAAYRLAKFNSSEQSNEYFSGLPTPMMSIAAFAIPHAAEQSLTLNTLFNHSAFIILFVAVVGLLMISNIKLVSLKVGSANKQLNVSRILLVISCLLLIVFLKFFGVFLCLLVYLILSLTIQKKLI